LKLHGDECSKRKKICQEKKLTNSNTKFFLLERGIAPFTSHGWLGQKLLSSFAQAKLDA
jgi:hypothetical protein